MDLDRLAILPDIGDAGNFKQAGEAERGDAADAFAAGLRFDLRWRAFCDDLALIDDGDAVGESVGLL